MADGAVMEPKAFNARPQEERQRIEGEIEKLQGELQDVVKLIPGWATEHRDALRELNREITAQNLDQPIDRVNARFGTIPGIGRDRKRVVQGKSGSEHVDPGGRRIHKKKNKEDYI